MAFPLALPCPAASLFHDPNGTAFADLAIDGHRETWPIRSRQFRHWRRRYYEETGSAAGAQTITSAVDLLEARAQFDAPERPVHIPRLGADAAGVGVDADPELRPERLGDRLELAFAPGPPYDRAPRRAPIGRRTPFRM